MAHGEANGTAAYDVVELEATGKDGLSWHPCQVSLCPRGRGLIVQYGNNKSDEMIADVKELSAHIRVRSTPLQGDDCLSIRQGDHVLATQTSRANVFYDAQVEKAIHVRHSKRTHCRCSFTIKWLHHALPEEALTVPASAIMKLATKSIHLHPTISAFVGMQESPDALDAMPCSMVADGKNWEMDLNLLLEQQIKAISTSTYTPQENILKDFVPGHKDKLTGSNDCENKQPIKLIVETPAPTPLIHEELTGSRLLLNPLAARAALASLRSEVPQSPELSARCYEKGDMTGKRSTSSLPQGSTFCSFSAVGRSLNADDFSLQISATLDGKSPNIRGIVKKLFPTSTPPHIVEISDLSSGAQLNGMQKKKEIGEKKTSRSAEPRLTRSQIQKRHNQIHETSQVTKNNETQLRLAGTRRVTRSRVGVAEKVEAEEYTQKVDLMQNAEKYNNSKKLTRSADRQDTESNDVQPKSKQRKRELTESNLSTEGSGQISFTSTRDTKTNGRLAEEGESRKMSTRVKTTPKSSESSDQGTRKTATSNKQETRSSPRLRLLPRTRSQTKA